MLTSSISLAALHRHTELQGPGKGGALLSCTVVAPMLSLMWKVLSLIWKVPIVGVDRCAGHIETGRVVTGAQNPVVPHVSL